VRIPMLRAVSIAASLIGVGVISTHGIHIAEQWHRGACADSESSMSLMPEKEQTLREAGLLAGVESGIFPAAFVATNDVAAAQLTGVVVVDRLIAEQFRQTA